MIQSAALSHQGNRDVLINFCSQCELPINPRTNRKKPCPWFMGVGNKSPERTDLIKTTWHRPSLRPNGYIWFFIRALCCYFRHLDVQYLHSHHIMHICNSCNLVGFLRAWGRVPHTWQLHWAVLLIHSYQSNSRKKTTKGQQQIWMWTSPFTYFLLLCL